MKPTTGEKEITKKRKTDIPKKTCCSVLKSVILVAWVIAALAIAASVRLLRPTPVN